MFHTLDYIYLDFMARSTILGDMEPWQKPVAGIALLFLAKHD